MTIEDADIIDNAGIAKDTNEVVLVISDHLQWVDEAFHFSLLEKKINRYVDFIKSGQLLELMPRAKESPIRINIICKYHPSDSAIKFLSEATQQLATIGVNVSYELLPKGY